MASSLKFWIYKVDRSSCTIYMIYVAKTKALISFTVTAKLICVCVFAYAKSWFSHDITHMCLTLLFFVCLFGLRLCIPINNLFSFSKQQRCRPSCIYTWSDITQCCSIIARCLLSLVVRKLFFWVSNQVQHKPGCIATEDGQRLEISYLGRRGFVLYV